MTSATILTAILTLGVHWGWQPVAGGGIEYIIRIDPFTVDSMREGHDVFSDLPPSLPAIRSYRVTISDKPVPHEGEPPPAPSKSVSAARPPAEATSQPSLAGELQLPPPPTTGSNLFPPPRLVSPSAAPSGSSNTPARVTTPVVAPATHQPSSLSSSAARSSTESHVQHASSNAGSSAAVEPGKPWAALAGVSIGLFASLAANAWLVWMALGFRKYLAQVARLKPTV